MVGESVQSFQNNVDEFSRVFGGVEMLEEEVGRLVGEVAELEAQFDFGEVGWLG